jgi:hypothetical protein
MYRRDGETFMLRWLALVICMLQIMPAMARMYQWNDPVTGTTQLSGSPPAWYRSGEDGPRVYVFERGRVIDDTGIPVTEDRRVYLRSQAILKAEPDTETQAEYTEHARAPLKRSQMLDQLARLWEQLEDANEIPDWQAVEDSYPETWDDFMSQGSGRRLTPDQVEQLRDLISSWQAEQESAIRRILLPQGEQQPAQIETIPEELPDAEYP